MHTKPVSKSIGKDIGLEKKQNDVESDDALFPFDEDLTADQENGLEDRRRRKGKEKMKETDKVCCRDKSAKTTGADANGNCVGGRRPKYG